MRYCLLCMVGFVLFSCSEEPSPREVYEDYNKKVIAGMAFEDEKRYFTKEKISEVEASFPRYMKQMKKTEEEVIEFYEKFSREVAKCKKISLIEETIIDKGATLVYSQIDVCGNESDGKEMRTIQLKKESGWKLHEIEIGL